MKKFSSFQELQTFIKTRPADGVSGTLGSARQSGEKTLRPFSSDFSGTNIQVQGVDEADMVKTDGEYIYTLSGKNVFIVKANPASEAEVASKIFLNATASEIFIRSDRLTVLGNYPSETHSFVKIYDITDRRNPFLVREFLTDGEYFTSRMIENYVYFVSRSLIWQNKVVLPKIFYGCKTREIDATEIYYCGIPDYSYQFVTLMAINIENESCEPEHLTLLLGATNVLYASLNNIYIAVGRNTWSKNSQRTLLHRIQIVNDEIRYVAYGEVPGNVLNQFSLDEFEGYLRVATTTGHVFAWSSEEIAKNHVYVLNMDLDVVGKLENLAPGEKIHSARFMGNRCYLVTFKKIDPLFVIDLENPSDPRVLGYLKVSGYSDYLHLYDETHLIGVGKETVEAESGNFALNRGVKISFFDVTFVTAPEEIGKYVIGDRGTESPVLSDHKAFLFDKSKKLLVIPILLAECQTSGSFLPFLGGGYVWQGAYVFTISLDDGLALKGRVTHIEDSNILDVSFHVKRALYIGNVLYTVSDRKIVMNSLDDLRLMGKVELV
ncbi:MAG: beta-propeller domain-containing protein [Candidatus Bathyarchaeia archaeon]